MLAAWIGYSQRVMEFSIGVALHEQTGQPVNIGQRLDRVDRLASDHNPRVMWQPERIPDRELEQMAEGYFEFLSHLMATLYGPTIDASRVTELTRDLGKMQKRITCRMDELKWPEVDD